LQRIPFKNLASVGGCLKSINQHRRRRFPLFLPTNYSEEPYLSVGAKFENVRRVRIADNTDPFEIVKWATVVSHAHLHTALQEAMDKTVRQLACCDGAGRCTKQ